MEAIVEHFKTYFVNVRNNTALDNPIKSYLNLYPGDYAIQLIVLQFIDEVVTDATKRDEYLKQIGCKRDELVQIIKNNLVTIIKIIVPQDDSTLREHLIQMYQKWSSTTDSLLYKYHSFKILLKDLESKEDDDAGDFSSPPEPFLSPSDEKIFKAGLNSESTVQRDTREQFQLYGHMGVDHTTAVYQSLNIPHIHSRKHLYSPQDQLLPITLPSSTFGSIYHRIPNFQSTFWIRSRQHVMSNSPLIQDDIITVLSANTLENNIFGMALQQFYIFLMGIHLSSSLYAMNISEYKIKENEYISNMNNNMNQSSNSTTLLPLSSPSSSSSSPSTSVNQDGTNTTIPSPSLSSSDNEPFTPASNETLITLFSCPGCTNEWTRGWLTSAFIYPDLYLADIHERYSAATQHILRVIASHYVKQITQYISRKPRPPRVLSYRSKAYTIDPSYKFDKYDTTIGGVPPIIDNIDNNESTKMDKTMDSPHSDGQKPDKPTPSTINPRIRPYVTRPSTEPLESPGLDLLQHQFYPDDISIVDPVVLKCILLHYNVYQHSCGYKVYSLLSSSLEQSSNDDNNKRKNPHCILPPASSPSSSVSTTPGISSPGSLATQDPTATSATSSNTSTSATPTTAYTVAGDTAVVTPTTNTATIDSSTVVLPSPRHTVQFRQQYLANLVKSAAGDSQWINTVTRHMKSYEKPFDIFNWWPLLQSSRTNPVYGIKPDSKSDSTAKNNDDDIMRKSNEKGNKNMVNANGVICNDGPDAPIFSKTHVQRRLTKRNKHLFDRIPRDWQELFSNFLKYKNEKYRLGAKLDQYLIPVQKLLYYYRHKSKLPPSNYLLKQTLLRSKYRSNMITDIHKRLNILFPALPQNIPPNERSKQLSYSQHKRRAIKLNRKKIVLPSSSQIVAPISKLGPPRAHIPARQSLLAIFPIYATMDKYRNIVSALKTRTVTRHLFRNIYSNLAPIWQHTLITIYAKQAMKLAPPPLKPTNKGASDIIVLAEPELPALPLEEELKIIQAAQAIEKPSFLVDFDSITRQIIDNSPIMLFLNQFILLCHEYIIKTQLSDTHIIKTPSLLNYNELILNINNKTYNNIINLYKIKSYIAEFILALIQVTSIMYMNNVLLNKDKITTTNNNNNKQLSYDTEIEYMKTVHLLEQSYTMPYDSVNIAFPDYPSPAAFDMGPEKPRCDSAYDKFAIDPYTMDQSSTALLPAQPYHPHYQHTLNSFTPLYDTANTLIPTPSSIPVIHINDIMPYMSLLPSDSQLPSCLIPLSSASASASASILDTNNSSKKTIPLPTSSIYTPPTQSPISIVPRIVPCDATLYESDSETAIDDSITPSTALSPQDVRNISTTSLSVDTITEPRTTTVTEPSTSTTTTTTEPSSTNTTPSSTSTDHAIIFTELKEPSSHLPYLDIQPSSSNNHIIDNISNILTCLSTLKTLFNVYSSTNNTHSTSSTMSDDDNMVGMTASSLSSLPSCFTTIGITAAQVKSNPTLTSLISLLWAFIGIKSGPESHYSKTLADILPQSLLSDPVSSIISSTVPPAVPKPRSSLFAAAARAAASASASSSSSPAVSSTSSPTRPQFTLSTLHDLHFAQTCTNPIISSWQTLLWTLSHHHIPLIRDNTSFLAQITEKYPHLASLTSLSSKPSSISDHAPGNVELSFFSSQYLPLLASQMVLFGLIQAPSSKLPSIPQASKKRTSFPYLSSIPYLSSMRRLLSTSQSTGQWASSHLPQQWTYMVSSWYNKISTLLPSISSTLSLLYPLDIQQSVVSSSSLSPLSSVTTLSSSNTVTTATLPSIQTPTLTRALYTLYQSFIVAFMSSYNMSSGTHLPPGILESVLRSPLSSPSSSSSLIKIPYQCFNLYHFLRNSSHLCYQTESSSLYSDNIDIIHGYTSPCLISSREYLSSPSSLSLLPSSSSIFSKPTQLQLSLGKYYITSTVKMLSHYQYMLGKSYRNIIVTDNPLLLTLLQQSQPVTLIRQQQHYLSSMSSSSSSKSRKRNNIRNNNRNHNIKHTTASSHGHRRSSNNNNHAYNNNDNRGNYNNSAYDNRNNPPHSRDYYDRDNGYNSNRKNHGPDSRYSAENRQSSSSRGQSRLMNPPPPQRQQQQSSTRIPSTHAPPRPPIKTKTKPIQSLRKKKPHSRHPLALSLKRKNKRSIINPIQYHANYLGLRSMRKKRSPCLFPTLTNGPSRCTTTLQYSFYNKTTRDIRNSMIPVPLTPTNTSNDATRTTIPTAPRNRPPVILYDPIIPYAQLKSFVAPFLVDFSLIYSIDSGVLYRNHIKGMSSKRKNSKLSKTKNKTSSTKNSTANNSTTTTVSRQPNIPSGITKTSTILSNTNNNNNNTTTANNTTANSTLDIKKKQQRSKKSRNNNRNITYKYNPKYLYNAILSYYLPLFQL